MAGDRQRRVPNRVTAITGARRRFGACETEQTGFSETRNLVLPVFKRDHYAPIPYRCRRRESPPGLV